jgi:hypothetical protein
LHNNLNTFFKVKNKNIKYNEEIKKVTPPRSKVKLPGYAKNIIVPFTSSTYENGIQVSGGTIHHSYYSTAGVFIGSSGYTNACFFSMSFLIFVNSSMRFSV